MKRIYEIAELKEWPSAGIEQYRNGQRGIAWVLAKPILGWDLWQRIEAAFCVLCNRAVAVRWY